MTDSLSLFLSKEKVKTKFLEKTSFPESYFFTKKYSITTSIDSHKIFSKYYQ